MPSGDFASTPPPARASSRPSPPLTHNPRLICPPTSPLTMTCSTTDILLCLLAFVIPPIPVMLKRGVLNMDTVINIVLCVLGWVPGVLHAWYIVSQYPHYVLDMDQLAQGDGANSPAAGPSTPSRLEAGCLSAEGRKASHDPTSTCCSGSPGSCSNDEYEAGKQPLLKRGEGKGKGVGRSGRGRGGHDRGSRRGSGGRAAGRQCSGC